MSHISLSHLQSQKTVGHFLKMLRMLLRDGGAGKSLIDKLELFKDDPGLLERAIIASEISLEFLDVLLARLFGSDIGKNVSAESSSALNVLCENLELFANQDKASGNTRERSLGSDDESNVAREGLQRQVTDLERQIVAMQRQLQMQSNVSVVTSSVEKRLEEVVSSCERRLREEEEREAALIKDVSAQVAGIREDVSRLEQELDSRTALAVQGLRDEVSRLKAAEEKLKADMQRHRHIQVYDSSKPLDGIIAHLTREIGNVHEQGIVNVTASSTGATACHPRYVTSLGVNLCFGSKNEPNSWICWDFKEGRVSPMSYSIMTILRGQGNRHLKSWALEVSNDGENWKVIDSRENSNDLNDCIATENFKIRPRPCGSFRFVRLRMTGPNHFGDYSLHINSLEFFGDLLLM